jgi:predicted aconitase
MRLTDEEQAMLAGERGEALRWAVAHQLQVGRFFDAPDTVPVQQAHIMADPESLGEAGVTFLETLAGARVRVPTRSARPRPCKPSSAAPSPPSRPRAC